jgi:membrane protease YdiL (CAAX protease family)
MTDTPYNPIPHKQMHPSLQFLTLIGLVIAAMIVGTFISMGIIYSAFGRDVLTDVTLLKVSSIQAQKALWILQLLSTSLPLLLTPVFFSYVVIREPDNYLKTTFQFPWLLIVIVFFTMFLASPLMEYISNFNQNLNLPQWMRDNESELEKVQDSMLEMKTFPSMIFNLFFIGLVTALAEEFLFRGCLQTIFIRWIKNSHIAIWIIAILFSAFHNEFLGFIPRLMLGLFFGYFTYWSGSIWPSIWAHFINNGTVVVWSYLYQNKTITLSPSDPHLFNTAGYIISLIITLFLLFVYRYISSKKQIADFNGEELD